LTQLCLIHPFIENHLKREISIKRKKDRGRRKRR